MRSFVIAQVLLLISTFVTLCCGHAFYQQQIPNGEMVPHPCKTNYLWRGVGHLNREGGGSNNAFGLDFKANGHVWNTTLCQKDSDGDGRTNGEELGDPDCIWRPGTAPSRSTGLSHPGVCEPINAPHCLGLTDFVDCSAKTFNCPVLSEPETFNYTVRFPETRVPAEETTYICMIVDLPTDDAFHLVATTPLINNDNVMHHILLHGCDGEVERETGQPYRCNMGAGRACNDIIAAWTVGDEGNCMHPQIGIAIGANGYKKAALQMHWNNPQLKDDYVDSSGLTLYLTNQLRPNEAGVVTIGQNILEIPPLTQSVSTEGRCKGSCTSRIMNGPVYITSTGNHMHYLGISQKTVLIKNSTNVTYDLAWDRVFNYDSPVTHTYTDPIRMDPGDDLVTTCTYKSTSRTYTTYFGESTNEEMCYAFITYYPKNNFKTPFCVSNLEIGLCDWYINRKWKGCDMKIASNRSHPETAAIIQKIMTKCIPGSCQQECLEAAREIKQHPCFQGSVAKILRKQARDKWSVSGNTEELMFYALLDSCDRELALEECQQDSNTGRGNDVSGASGLTSHVTITVIVVLLWHIFKV